MTRKRVAATGAEPLVGIDDRIAATLRDLGTTAEPETSCLHELQARRAKLEWTDSTRGS
ncbi:hypothetical protein [Micromonospora sp. NPDC005173]|uniref:hypothetical protein n=1 Tax=Micromonospora sp. NPDC005173 TaxID=3157165 RepID=UPI0033A8EF2D